MRSALCCVSSSRLKVNTAVILERVHAQKIQDLIKLSGDIALCRTLCGWAGAMSLETSLNGNDVLEANRNVTPLSSAQLSHCVTD